jgi:cell division protein FtsI/penicillin-binding protein 2
MFKAHQYRRLLGLSLLLLAAFIGLGYRLFELQVLRHEELRSKAQNNTRRTLLLEPRRGDIRDIRGNLLATSLPVKTLCADPVLIGRFQSQVAHVLAPLLQINEAELTKQLQPRTHVNGDGETVTNRYVVLKRKLAVETWQQICRVMTNLTFGLDEKRLPKKEQALLRDLRQHAIFTDKVDDQLRVYPNQKLASHILGYVGMAEREVNGATIIETAGKDGIELVLNSKLSGVGGWRQTETDRRRRELVALRQQEVEARDGLNVVLTIDAGLQNILESELSEAVKKHTPVSATAIMIRPQTGEILAMATLPNFDPNWPGDFSADHRRNRAITDQFEPGSTFKIVTVSGALNDHLVTLNDTFDCEHGHFAFAGKVLKEHESAGYGNISVETILAKSSNIGTAKIGIKLGDQRLYHYIREFGFNAATRIDLPGEVRGTVHPVKDWSKLSISRLPIGQGVAVTPLQMVMAMSTIANGGKLIRPAIIDRLEDEQGQVVARSQPLVVRNVIDAETARQMTQALKTVVSANGTAVKAKLDYYTVAGKTGTAQKPGPGGYQPGKYFSSFIGFFPADRPELVIGVMLDEPKNGYYGGQSAAPCFKNIAQRAANYLNIRPEAFKPETLAAAGQGATRLTMQH